MASVGYATLSVIPSAKNFGKNLASEVDPQLDVTGRSSGARFGRVLGGAAMAAIGVALAGVGAVVKTGIDEALDASKGIAQLEAGIKSTGGAAGVTGDHLTDLAGSLQLMSGQTDDSIVAAEQLLLTFTNIRNTETDKIFDRATLATTNMAAKMGGDASGSAIQLGKALQDPVAGMAGLSRAGIQFTQSQKDAIEAMVATGDILGAQKVILGEVETQFGGAAEAAGKSLPGQLEIMKRKFEDVSQSIAENLIPVVLPALTKIASVVTDKIVPALKVFFDALSGNSELNEFDGVLKSINNAGVNLNNFFRDAAEVIGPFLARMSSLFQSFRDGKQPVEDVTGVLAFAKDMWAQISTVWTTQVAPALSDLWALFNEKVLPVIKDVTAQFNEKLKPALSDLSDFIVAYVMPVVKVFFDSWVTGMKIFVSDVLPVLIKIGGWIAEYIVYKVRDSINTVSALIDAFKNLYNGAKDIASAIGSAFKAAFNGIASAWNKSVGSLSFTIPDIVGVPNRGETFSFPKIPLLAEGGIVTKPTLAMIGEGPDDEAVIPLRKLDAMLSGRGGGNGQTINIYGIQDIEQIVAELPRLQARLAA